MGWKGKRLGPKVIQRLPLSLRVTREMREAIIASCVKSGHSISAEAEILMLQGLRDKEVLSEIRSLKSAIILGRK